MRTMRWIVLAGALLSQSQAWGVEVFLINGWRFSGDARLTPKTVYVRLGTATKEIPRGSVRAIELSPGEQIECAKMKAALGMAAEGYFKLGKWLEGKCQFPEAAKQFEKALLLDKDHAGARSALGYERNGDGWVKSEEKTLQLHSLWLGPEGARACFELAKKFRETGDEKGVEKMLRQALIALPTHPDALAMMMPITDKYVSKNKYRLPVDGLWAVMTDYNGHHKKTAFMAYALDMVKLDENFRASAVQNPQKVEDMYTWGQPIYAAADGTVSSIKDGSQDHPLGETGELWDSNMVCIDHANGEQTSYGHLQKGSIVVKQGQKVKAGQLIARAGNSGASMMPHLHWQLIDRDGIGLPMRFVDFIEVTRDGEKPVNEGRAYEEHVYRNRIPGAAEQKGGKVK